MSDQSMAEITRIPQTKQAKKTMAEPIDRYSRREFFKKAGKVAKVATVGIIGGTFTGVGLLAGADSAESLADHLKAPHTPTDVYKGEIEVEKGVSIRLTPFVPGPREESNTVNWDDIRFAPNVAADKNSGLYKKSSFKLENSLIYTRPDGSRWIMWDAFLLRKLLTQPTTFFINIGPDTANFVKLQQGGEFLKIIDSSRDYRTQDGIVHAQGKVSVTPR